VGLRTVKVLAKSVVRCAPRPIQQEETRND